MNLFVKLLLTALILILGVPGLVIEPGPFSEIAVIGGLSAVWGLDWGTDQGGGDN